MAVPHRQRDDERHRRGVARPRVAVRRQRHGRTGVDQAAPVGIGLARGEVRRRQQRGHGRRPGQRLDVLTGQVGAVVGRRAAELDGQPHPRPLPQLVGVHPAGQPLRHPCPQHLPRLVGVEGPLLAEHVHRSGEGCAGVQHLPGHERHVSRRVRRVLGRHDVGAQVGGVRGDLPGQPQQARLAVRRGRVARLDLQRRDPRRAGLGHPAGQRGPQLLVRRRPGRPDRGGDAAGGVGLAGHAGGELRRPVTGEDHVGVAVDEARQDRPAAQRHPLVCRRGRPRPDGDDTAGVDDQPGIGKAPADLGVVPAHPGRRRVDAGGQGVGGVVGGQPGDVGEGGAGHEDAPIRKGRGTSAAPRPRRTRCAGRRPRRPGRPRWCG